MTTIPFGPQLIGRTEKALNALLNRELSGTGLTEPQWVVLTLTVLSKGEPGLPARIAEALRVPEPDAHDHLAALTAAGLVEAGSTGATPTAYGLDVWNSVRAATVRITDSLWSDLPESDRTAAAHVLNTVLARAGAALAAA
ncbi:helix-turn-helix transcriptional regulator [Actinoplanes sp. LDG1-06]|uniref:Helix-turn-helix transcriptional regulator n=1 Tax=Paractinoplanes ovalisporus TaxID=2810368 RepID=A0ABS2A2G5_9ACTN|nr:MarR family winged helix-turn-helix transcriptional regulator [Actinoplanes ovalisporus]MBM2614025.1 helix-turn-helix transcriptional regulator [Actinoplanes ovalisporus]